ncbi:unnamed protein product [Dovyalis caffra]|uniref:Uncharacterized protein n=1 Tax=Dovyalis caffra TaxID=77055 RepID=A0AAV1S965_9ROSI|nr:unnamed protein product [Dovyalis caffra]
MARKSPRRSIGSLLTLGVKDNRLAGNWALLTTSLGCSQMSLNLHLLNLSIGLGSETRQRAAHELANYPRTTKRKGSG